MWFWFDRELFSQRWLTERIQESIIDARNRYSPAIDVELPVSRIFDAYGRTNAFYMQLKAWVPRLRRRQLALGRTAELSTDFDRSLKALHESFDALCTSISSVDETSVEPIEYVRMSDRFEQIRKEINACEKALKETSASLDSGTAEEETPARHQLTAPRRQRDVAGSLWRLGAG